MKHFLSIYPYSFHTDKGLYFRLNSYGDYENLESPVRKESTLDLVKEQSMLGLGQEVEIQDMEETIRFFNFLQNDRIEE